MTKLGNDFRQALRVAAHQKSVTVMAIVAFALGIGITTAVFSIFNGVLLAPLPFPDPEQLVAVFDTQPACATCPASYPKYHDWKRPQSGLLGDWRVHSGLLRDDRCEPARTAHRRVDDGVVERRIPRPAVVRTLVYPPGGSARRPQGGRLVAQVLDARIQRRSDPFSDVT